MREIGLLERATGDSYHGFFVHGKAVDRPAMQRLAELGAVGPIEERADGSLRARLCGPDINPYVALAVAKSKVGTA